MTNQEMAEVVSPAIQYIDSQISYAQDTFIAPSFKGIKGNKARRADIHRLGFSPLQELRADLSANLELISQSIDNSDSLFDDEINEKRNGLSIGYEQIGFILALELASGILNDTVKGDDLRQIHLPGGHPVHIISKIHLLEHIKVISNLTGNYHLEAPELDYSKKPELNPHPSCLIGSIGRIALIHHVPMRELGSYIHVTPLDQLAISA